MPEETTAVTMSNILDSAGDVFGAATGWVGQVATVITEQPLLLLPAIVGLAFLGVGLYKRLAH